MEKYFRLHHVLIYVGLIAGAVIGRNVDTDAPRLLVVIASLGIGLLGGAFVAAIVTGEALVGGPSPSKRGGRRGGGRPAWFDDDDQPSNGTR